MRVLLCQDRFTEKIVSGVKRHTIRRSAKCKPGDTLSLREANAAEKVILETTCTGLYPVTIYDGGVMLGSHKLDEESLAVHDGFTDWEEMRCWFIARYKLPFSGWLIEWGV